MVVDTQKYGIKTMEAILYFSEKWTGLVMKAVSRKSLKERTLYYFPIVHTTSDMGELSEAVRTLYLEKVGRVGLRRKEDLISKFWDAIEKSIAALEIGKSRIRVYQDGLPSELPDKELGIVEELAASGSRNHSIVLELIKKGATLVGTESINLLVTEYDLTKKLLDSGSVLKKKEKSKILEMQDGILKKRDQFIASRINETLEKGEVGIIFLGMLHNIKPWLAEDIEVIFPLKAEKINASGK